MTVGRIEGGMVLSGLVRLNSEGVFTIDETEGLRRTDTRKTSEGAHELGNRRSVGSETQINQAQCRVKTGTDGCLGASSDEETTEEDRRS